MTTEVTAPPSQSETASHRLYSLVPRCPAHGENLYSEHATLALVALLPATQTCQRPVTSMSVLDLLCSPQELLELGRSQPEGKIQEDYFTFLESLCNAQKELCKNQIHILLGGFISRLALDGFIHPTHSSLTNLPLAIEEPQ